MDDLSALVKSLVQKATRLTAAPPQEMPVDAHLRSHFGGHPYFTQGETWPTRKDGKTPLDFIFQVYNDGSLNLPGHIRLLQFFFDLDELDVGYYEDEDIWRVKIYKDVDPANAVFIGNLRALKNVNYCEIAFVPMQSLPDWQGLDVYCDRLSFSVNDYDALVEEFLEEQDLGAQRFDFRNWLGGYPVWIQDTGNEDPNDQLLFQVDLEDMNAFVNNGIGLMAYVFYNEKTTNLKCVFQYM
jgi:uncharacterized protein YwqG